MVAQVKQTDSFEESTASTITSTQRYAPETYLEIETRSDERHEYRDGEIISMAGATPNHNCITLNIGSFLNFALRQQPYQVFVSDQRLYVANKNLYTYPDVMIISGELELQQGRKDTVTNPLLIVEVRSESAVDSDRGDKFSAYRTIPGFQEYLLVSQYTQQIEHYIKVDEKKWSFQAYDHSDKGIQLGTIDREITIADIYNKVKFAPETVTE